jgi:DNA-binding PadR family transcriptional regulator
MNVKILCLGFLSLRNATGYEIKKDVEEGLFSHFIDASFGSIYPALSQLSADGCVTVEEMEQTGKPDKKVYAITERGREVLAKSMVELPGKDKYKSDFLFHMLFQQLLSDGQLIAAIDKQLSDLREDLACIDECRGKSPPSPGDEFVSGYGYAVLTAAVSYLEHKRAELLKPAAAIAAE